MYLIRRVYVKNWQHRTTKNKVTVMHKLKTDRRFKTHPLFKTGEVSYLETEVIYWAGEIDIHAWFMNNAQAVTSEKFICQIWDLENLLLYVKSAIQFSKTTAYTLKMQATEKALENVIADHRDAMADGVPNIDVSYIYEATH